MTDSELIDPFDDPATLENMRVAPTAPTAASQVPARAQQGELVDPFDDPGFLDRMNAERLRGRVGQRLHTAFGEQPQRQRAKTLQDRGREVFGFDDLKSRGSFLPRGETHSGEMVFAAPQWLKDAAEAYLLPSHAYEGGAYTADDALGFTLNFGLPGTQGRAPTKRPDFVRDAPSTEALRSQSKRFKAAASDSGVRVNPDSYADLMASVETTVQMNRLNPRLHPGSSAVFDELSKAVGQDLDIDDLQQLRRLIGSALRSTDPNLADDRRVAGLMQDALDDYVEKLGTKDVLAGDPTKAGANLKQFRSLYARSKKSEAIEEIIQKAERQASGFENGIRIGFRALLNRRGGTRGFSQEEISLMEQIASGGTSGQKLMRLLGKLSFSGSGGNFLGGSIGAGTGATVGAGLAGPLGAYIGAAAPHVVGSVAKSGSEKAAIDSAALARAMAATGRSAPDNSLSVNTLRNLLERAGGPAVNMLAPQIDPYDPDIL